VEHSVRYGALDGLRGIAALVVVIHHSLLTIAVLSLPYYVNGAGNEPGTLPWLLIYTPLHIAWEGTGAVFVFFVLSGFVLTLPVVGGGYDWVSYYPQRLLRLYLPVWGAVILAVVLMFIVPRTADVSSAWLSLHPDRFVTIHLLQDLTLVPGAGWFASPLWSLTWEVLFSLLLPVIVWLTLRLRRAHGVLLVVAILVSAVGGATGVLAVAYMPMFVVGVIIAMNRDAIRAWCARLGTAAWIGIAVLAVLGLTSGWLLAAFGIWNRVRGAATGVALVAAALFVIMALEWPGARRTFETRPLRTLGRLSFSLYLVHEPIIVAVAFVFPNDPLVGIPVALVVVAIVTPLFFLGVERPAHRLAVRVGGAIRNRRTVRRRARDPHPGDSETATE
jgi:peptidoglycan/LPS O-acetylase OafA/YrhL